MVVGQKMGLLNNASRIVGAFFPPTLRSGRNLQYLTSIALLSDKCLKIRTMDNGCTHVNVTGRGSVEIPSSDSEDVLIAISEGKNSSLKPQLVSLTLWLYASCTAASVVSCNETPVQKTLNYSA
jgi:hypothetical protein